jgi:hypothetical protein
MNCFFLHALLTKLGNLLHPLLMYYLHISGPGLLSRYSDWVRAKWTVDRILLFPVAARSKAWACGRSLAGTANSNPAGGIDVCVLYSKGQKAKARTKKYG